MRLPILSALCSLAFSSVRSAVLPSSSPRGRVLEQARSLAVTPLPPIETTMTLPCGTVNVTGLAYPSHGYSAYLGIPYAIPPVGSRRFRAPEMFEYEDQKTYDGTALGPACLQREGPYTSLSGMNEDCLTINVYAPSDARGSNLPVLAWVYGGAFVEGSAAVYNATNMVYESIAIGEPTIVVTLNYRLGIFGWGQGQEFARNNATNLGLKDQLLGLQWIQENVHVFGGDPRKVTVFGESAGAVSIALHYLNPVLINDTPENNTLFRAAIFESGAPSTFPVASPYEIRQEVFDTLTEISNCTDSTEISPFECLRELPSDELFAAQLALTQRPAFSGLPFGPVVDGELLTGSPAALIREGRFAKLPYISGGNLDEGTVFIPPTLNTTAGISDFINLIWPLPVNAGVVDTLLDFYSNASAGSPFGTGDNTFGLSAAWKRAAAIFGDLFFHAPRRDFLEVTAANGMENSTWSYHYVHNQNSSRAIGSFHGSELVYVWGAPPALVAYFGAPDDLIAGFGNFSDGVPASGSIILSRQMMAYWLTFAQYLNPNGNQSVPRDTNRALSDLGLIEWPLHSAVAGGASLRFDVGELSQITDDFRAEPIDFMNSVPEALLH